MNLTYVKARRPRPPLRTVEEIAEKLGIDPATLAGLIGAHTRYKNPPPAPLAVGIGRKHYYNTKAMRLWYEALNLPKTDSLTS